MAEDISLDGRTLVGVANTDAGEVSGDTRFEFEQEGERIYAHLVRVRPLEADVERREPLLAIKN
ncbi:hypothetical protein [Haloarcula amylovorans]|uniref:hypothetical protein n=1 Tax=Haloarcula amylovorans TaxID=2562280 RepID=UPI0010762B21|nr:hypothetical protein [Halomicroarcula amylolytica]